MYVPAWPVLSPKYVFSRNGHTDLPSPFNSNRGTYFHMARNGIYHLVRALGLQATDTVLVPDYHQGVEIQALRAAGASLRYYRVNRHLEPDLDDVVRLCRSQPRALYVIHFLGWPQPIDELGALCRAQGIVLIEDCALALLSAAGGRPLGTFGQYAIFCLYKTLPLPNGGVLVQNEDARNNLPDLVLNSPGLASVGGRSIDLMLEWVRSRSDPVGRTLRVPKKVLAHLLDAVRLKRQPAGTAELDLSQVNLGMAALCYRLLKRFDYAQIWQKRRDNFMSMRDKLAAKVTLLRSDLGEGVCPLFFPILVPDKHSVAQVLQRRGIGVLEWWNRSSASASPASAESQFLRDHLLGLPIHQDVTPAQVEYIAEQVTCLRPADLARPT